MPDWSTMSPHARRKAEEELGADAVAALVAASAGPAAATEGGGEGSARPGVLRSSGVQGAKGNRSEPFPTEVGKKFVRKGEAPKKYSKSQFILKIFLRICR